MDRRKFLVGVGGAAVGGSALIGSGAFTRVESQRQVSIQVAADPNAYLGLSPIENSLNSQNYVDLDENGHLYIEVGEIPPEENDIGGEGVNSDSYTYFDDMFRMCNQGKADADISYELPDPPAERNIPDDWTAPDDDHDDQVVGFYWVDEGGQRHFVEEGQEVPLPLGECENIGLRTATFGVNANNGDPLIDGDVILTADAPEAGEPEGTPEPQ